MERFLVQKYRMYGAYMNRRVEWTVIINTPILVNIKKTYYKSLVENEAEGLIFDDDDDDGTG